MNHEAWWIGERARARAIAGTTRHGSRLAAAVMLGIMAGIIGVGVVVILQWLTR